ncbi:hypothetical protein F4861DRAFT_505684 [Xylaria intraflava]|nr:hypothetical protein F4861DRAFT_505684 [Xylaria intraflava]
MGRGRGRDKHAHQSSDDDHTDSTESDSQATTDNDTEDEARSEMENALVQSALARIRKAKAKGKQDVRLNKEELAALERRRKRLQAEADKRKGKDRRGRKEQEKRVAVPLSHFDSTTSGRGQPRTADDDAWLRHSLPSTMIRSRAESGSPVGLSSPGTSQTHPRSPASSHLASSQRHGSSSPFDYQYVSTPPNQRHASDTSMPNSSFNSIPHGEDWYPQPSSSHHPPDPFQYQTDGPRARYPTGTVAYSNMSHSGGPTAARSSLGEMVREDDTGSDGHGNGARVSQHYGQHNVTGLEAGSSPEPELGSSRTTRATSRNASPAKRKPAGTSGGRRRKVK